MREKSSVAESSWPSDMEIRVGETQDSLLQLLYIRDAWRLTADEAPPLDENLRVPAVPRPARVAHLSQEDLDQRWAADWARAWWQFNPPVDADPNKADFEYGFESTEFWNEELDWESFEVWKMRVEASETNCSERPELVSLPELIDAWNAGLRTIVPLPYAGDYARRISTSHLVVSRRTRRDPVAYALAFSKTD